MADIERALGLPALGEPVGGLSWISTAEILESILRGETRGPKRDLAVLNAAAGLVIAGIAPDLESAGAMAEEAIDASRAARVLDDWRAFA